MVTDVEISALDAKAREIRRTVIQMLVSSGSGHIAGSLGMVDVFTALYFYILKHDPENPDWENRDRVVLSNGHICPAQYATMAHAGYFPVEECLTLRKFGSRLQGHPERTRLPGIEITSGPLGEGLGQAAGIALALKGLGGPTANVGPTTSHNGERVFCIMSDGEQEEGSTWEAVMFVGKNKISNLTAIIDRNGIQIGGATEEIMPLEPLADKYRAFNWNVAEVDGNNIADFVRVVETSKNINDRPTVIIANTISGKGVPEIEGDYNWHGKVPTKEEGERFLKFLDI